MVEKRERARVDYEEGMKYKDIAEKYSASINTVKSWIKRYGWKRNKKGAPTNKKGAPTKKAHDNLPALLAVSEGLTDKQQLFCLYYIRNFNATQSYLKAYGCSYDAARAEGYKLLTKPHIKSEIKRLKKIRCESIFVTEEDVVEQYMRIAFADITDFVDFGTSEVPMVDESGAIIIGEDGNVKTRKYDYLDFKQSGQIDGGLVCEISQGKNGMKIKLADKMKALEWLSAYFNMNPMSLHKIAYDQAILDLKERELAIKEF